MKRPFKRLCTICLLSVALATIAGCGKSISGVYTSPAMSIEFKDGGKATVTLMNSPVDATYTVEGSKVTVTANGGLSAPLIFTLDSDGSLAGADGSTLKKQ
jgi:hypothetical protein